MAPAEFWALTPREFRIKEAAFQRRENRARADRIDLALALGHYKQADRIKLQQQETALRTYPLKAWTLPPGMTPEKLALIQARRGLLRRGKSDDAS